MPLVTLMQGTGQRTVSEQLAGPAVAVVGLLQVVSVGQMLLPVTLAVSEMSGQSAATTLNGPSVIKTPAPGARVPTLIVAGGGGGAPLLLMSVIVSTVRVTSPVFVTANVTVKVSLPAVTVLTPGDPVLKQSFRSVMLGCSITWQVAVTGGRVPVLAPVVGLTHGVVLSM